MNITKDLFEYINIVRNSFQSHNFSIKIERQGIIDNCAYLLKSIAEVEKNIDGINKISTQTSLFNDSHLKINNLAMNVKDQLNRLQEEVEVIENSKFRELRANNYTKQAIYNTIELLKSRIYKISEKFKKSLQLQADIIKKVEERRSNFSANHKINKPIKNPFLYTSLPNDDIDTTDNSAHISFEQQNQVDNRNQYYQDRTSAVQKIEKTMTDLQGMFTRMAHFVHEQQYMIEKIENNTDISLGNIEAGMKEVIKIQNDVRSNRGLLIKIFLIIILASVIYILFFA